MNRSLWGIAFLVLVAGGGWGQSTWRGQAEVWDPATAPADGFVVASNDFPQNSLLTIENYKSHKTVQVRVVSTLPAGSAALVALNAKASQALEIKAGDFPLVGVTLDPTGTDRPDNPDPDVNPLAATPATALATAQTQDQTSGSPTTPASSAATPASPLPLPAVASSSAPAPAAQSDRAPLAVADEPEPVAPATPGKTIFQTTRDSEPVVAETSAPAASSEATPATPTPNAPPVAVAPPAPSVVSAPAGDLVPVAPVPPADATPLPAPASPDTETPTSVPAVTAAPAVAPVPTAPVAVKPATGSDWVAVPSKLEGPILGQVAVLPSLEKGRIYVQVGAWATEADVLKAMESLKTYVPLALFQAEGEKNPWRVVASAPKGQLGVLLMLFRSEGFRTASVVKG